MELVYTALNAAALAGWSLVLLALLLISFDPTSSPLLEDAARAHGYLYPSLLALEAVCFVEVGRIALGQLKGNLVLGAVLHAIRMTCLVYVLSDGILERDFISTVVLYSWSLTEVCRYPMYLFPESGLARYVRLVAPLATFPVGCAAEAYGAYRVLMESLNVGGEGLAHWAKVGLLGMVLLINGLLGPTMAYPALLKKGLPVLLGRPQKKRTKRE